MPDNCNYTVFAESDGNRSLFVNTMQPTMGVTESGAIVQMEGPIPIPDNWENGPIRLVALNQPECQQINLIGLDEARERGYTFVYGNPGTSGGGLFGSGQGVPLWIWWVLIAYWGYNTFRKIQGKDVGIIGTLSIPAAAYAGYKLYQARNVNGINLDVNLTPETKDYIKKVAIGVSAAIVAAAIIRKGQS